MLPTPLSTGFRKPIGKRPENSLIGLSAATCTILLAALFFANRPEILRIAICACAVIIGFILYLKSPLSYIQFTLWLWFFTPLLRRMIDFRFGFADQNLVLLAPILVTSLSVMAIRRLPAAKIHKFPFLLCMAGVSYGLTIGMLVKPSADVIYGFFNWIAPLFFGLFLYINWSSYSESKRVIQRTLLWGTVLIGSYGIYQYCSPPKWDVYWWQSLPYGMVAAFGRPFPYQVRVWSTLNAPEPFASAMAASLLLNFGSRSKLMLPFSLIGFMAFALSLIRAEWLGFIIGTLYLGIRSKPIYLMRGLAFAVLLGVVGIPLLSAGPAEKMVKERMDSLSHLSQDDSVRTRFAMYQHLTTDLLENPFGQGVSNAVVYRGYSLDSGPLSLLYNFGLLGSIFYMTGIGTALILLMLKNPSGDTFQICCTAVLISSVAKLAVLSPYMNIAGVMVWLCVGMGLASQRFHATNLVETKA